MSPRAHRGGHRPLLALVGAAMALGCAQMDQSPSAPPPLSASTAEEAPPELAGYEPPSKLKANAPGYVADGRHLAGKDRAASTAGEVSKSTLSVKPKPSPVVTKPPTASRYGRAADGQAKQQAARGPRAWGLVEDQKIPDRVSRIAREQTAEKKNEEAPARRRKMKKRRAKATLKAGSKSAALDIGGELFGGQANDPAPAGLRLENNQVDRFAAGVEAADEVEVLEEEEKERGAFEFDLDGERDKAQNEALADDLDDDVSGDALGTEVDGRFGAGGRGERSREVSRRDFARMLSGLEAEAPLGQAIERLPEDPSRFVEPPSLMPRMCYFENTYLGGNAAYAQRLEQLDQRLGSTQPYRQAALPDQPFDPPPDAGLSLTTSLDRTYVDRPQRVFLQIGLRGSDRFGWRRPPLDVALVVDRPALVTGGETLTRAVIGLLRKLGPQDRLGVFLAGPEPIELASIGPLRTVRMPLARRIENLPTVADAGAAGLTAALTRAGAALQIAAGQESRIPGSQLVILMTAGGDGARIASATAAAHALTVQGAVTSVIDVSAGGDWWSVANAGHGNFHRTTPEAIDATLDEELSSISRVIARLLRVNIRLAPEVEAIRVIGAKVLGQEEVAQVKAREEATDQNLSKTMGLSADRGEDDDGIQTVIPYFYGGDSHVILVELWVKQPGPVADVTLKFKDMVRLDNATASARATLDRVPRPLGPAERRVMANVQGFKLAEGLAQAARQADRGDRQQVRAQLDALRPLARGDDVRLLAAFDDLLQSRGADPTLAAALRMARDRRIGHPRAAPAP